MPIQKNSECGNYCLPGVPEEGCRVHDPEKTVPKVIIPPCPDCGYGHIDNGDGTSTTTMHRSAYLFGQCCEACGVKFGWEAEKAGVDIYAGIREAGRRHAERVNQEALDCKLPLEPK